MFLKDIELTNFKCHTHLKLDFSTGIAKTPTRKTTLLLGENGTGKSAVLKAIALVTAGSDALSDILGVPDTWIQNKKAFCKIQTTLVTADGAERIISLEIKRGQNKSKVINHNIPALAQIDDALEHADRNYFIMAYGASRRLNNSENIFGNSQQEYSSPRTKCIQSLFNQDAVLVSLASWAMDLDYSSSGNKMSIVKTALKEFMLEDVTFKKIDRKKRTLVFSTTDGEVALEHLSDGYQNVAAWVGDLLFNITTAFRNYKKPLEARGVLLIDEIDLHLHPNWQRRLHAFLEEKLPNFQVIVTTHSPLTAQQGKENELYALRREGKNVALVPFAGDPSKMLLHQILMSPVFGLETDESVTVEKKKNRVRYLSTKKNTTSKEKTEVKQLSAQVSKLPLNTRRNSTLDNKDIQLLKTINQQLKVKLK